MAIQIEWDDEAKTIIRHTYEPGWTLTEYHELLDHNSQMTMSVTHCVDIISDFSNSKTSPAQLVSVSRHVEQKLPTYPQISVAVNAPTLIKVIVEAVLRISSARGQLTVRFARSLDEARMIIRDYRATVRRAQV